MLVAASSPLTRIIPGLMIWTIVFFLIVFFVLRKFAFNAIQNLIAITTPQGVAVTLKVDASTKVIVDGKAGGLADLKSELVGQHAIALFQPGGNPPLARQVIVMTRGAESPGEG